jgi:hypothetical protein
VSHRLWTLFLLVACFLGISVSLWGQNAAAVPGIRGYLDPRTGIFHSTAQPKAPDDEPRATTTFAGKFVFNFTITVDSTIASTNKIACFAGASVTGDTTTTEIVDAAATAVTRGTGTTVKCTVTVPYSWKLASSSTDKVNLSYTVSSPGSFALTPETLYPNRQGGQSLGTIKVPLNGTTTTETITATM